MLGDLGDLTAPIKSIRLWSVKAFCSKSTDTRCLCLCELNQPAIKISPDGGAGGGSNITDEDCKDLITLGRQGGVVAELNWMRKDKTCQWNEINI